MRRIKFSKMVASGNDFVVLPENNLSAIRRPEGRGWQPNSQSYHSLSAVARKICDRKFGAGADGLLLINKSSKADIKMRIFNADGSEAEMCGNGARCAALWEKLKNKNFKKGIITIETKAGIIESQVNGGNVKIKLTDPEDLKLNIPLKVNNRSLKVDFINTGVPHVIIFVEGLDKIDVFGIGRAVRYHKKFAPRGANVNFVEPLSRNSFRIRSYERGVEGETLACGTGTVASALIFALKGGAGNKIGAHTRGGEKLSVYFVKTEGAFYNVWLEGKAGIVYEGEYYV